MIVKMPNNRPVVTVNLYAGVAVVGRHDSVLREHEVDGARALPPPQVDLQRGVGLRVPLVDLVEPVEDVAVDVLGHVLRQLELLLLVEEPGVDAVPALVLAAGPRLLLGDVHQLQPDGVLLPPVAVADVEHHHCRDKQQSEQCEGRYVPCATCVLCINHLNFWLQIAATVCPNEM